MKRINVHLTEKQISLLAKKSVDSGLPVAEIIRRAIDSYLKRG